MKTLADNKKARFDYEILEQYEAGCILEGGEVKSIKNGHISLLGSYVKLIGNRPYLVECLIPKYKFSTHNNFDEKRNKELLLNIKEIEKIKRLLNTSGLTVVPLKAYLKKGLIKISIAVVRGKKKHDKRQTIKERDIKRRKIY